MRFPAMVLLSAVTACAHGQADLEEIDAAAPTGTVGSADAAATDAAAADAPATDAARDAPPVTGTFAFQNGVEPTAGYVGCTDTYVAQRAPDTTFGGAATVNVDGDDPNGSGQDLHGLVRWDLPGLASGARVVRVRLVFSVADASASQAYQIFALRRVGRGRSDLAACRERRPMAGRRGRRRTGSRRRGARRDQRRVRRPGHRPAQRRWRRRRAALDRRTVE